MIRVSCCIKVELVRTVARKLSRLNGKVIKPLVYERASVCALNAGPSQLSCYCAWLIHTIHVSTCINVERVQTAKHLAR